jgi:hypothetical protein
MKTVIIIVTIMLSSVSICNSESVKKCDDIYLETIKTDFDKSYKQYKLFFGTLNCHGDNAINGDTSAISTIIGLYGIGNNNSEYTEWYAETIKEIFLKSPKKLFDILLQSNNKTINDIMYYLENPIDGEKKAIFKAAKKLDKTPKYRSLTKRLLVKDLQR